jgi:hypothetical protein
MRARTRRPVDPLNRESVAIGRRIDAALDSTTDRADPHSPRCTKCVARCANGVSGLVSLFGTRSWGHCDARCASGLADGPRSAAARPRRCTRSSNRCRRGSAAGVGARLRSPHRSARAAVDHVAQYPCQALLRHQRLAAGRSTPSGTANVPDLTSNVRPVSRHSGHAPGRRTNGKFRRRLSFNLGAN